MYLAEVSSLLEAGTFSVDVSAYLEYPVLEAGLTPTPGHALNSVKVWVSGPWGFDRLSDWGTGRGSPR